MLLKRIESHAEGFAEKIIVSYEGQNLSFAELNTQANQLARALQSVGVSEGTPVALWIERSLDLSLAVLAILKSGGIYVPLDPEQPENRLQQLIRETGVKLVLDQSKLSELKALCSEFSSDNLPHPNMKSIAYYMFTSGSTGVPKAVEIGHETLSERFFLSPYHQLNNADSVIAGITSVAWSPSVYEILYSLANNTKLEIASSKTVKDPRRLQQFLKEKKITFMRAVPSLWQALVDSHWKGESELVIVSHGEKLQSHLSEQLSRLGKSLYNTYGSTEATIFSLVETRSGNVSVIPAHECIELREGEIFYKGKVVATGYHGQTSFHEVYATGDLGRLLPEGKIELLGRKDKQVKIRGQRIDLSEVEANLLKSPDVLEAVTIFKDEQIIAFLLSKNEKLNQEQLRSFLEKEMMASMIPSAFHLLSEFPRNANGKIDRLALAQLNFSHVSLAYAAPETEIEKKLAKLFETFLKRAVVGIDDDFFFQGGHSLLAALVCTRAQELFGVLIELEEFYQNKTVRKLAHLVEQKIQQGLVHFEKPIVKLVKHKGPLSFSQERLWFMDKLSGKTAEYNLPWAIRLKGSLDPEALEKALRHLIQRHESLRSSFETLADGKASQIVHQDFPLHLSAEKRSVEEVRSWIEADCEKAFDLEAGLLWRTKLFQLGTDDFVFYFNLHHILSDGWSKTIFQRELAGLYQEEKLPELPIQYLDFAFWQRENLSEEKLEKQIHYWKKELSDLLTVDFPADRSRPKILPKLGGKIISLLPPKKLAGLKKLAEKEDVSLYMLLLSVYKVLLSVYCRETDLAIASPVAGRPRRETEGLIGFFVNTLIMRSQVDPQLPFNQYLQAVKRKALKAYQNQDLSFERLVSEINPERDLSRYPLTQIVFALQNTPYDKSDWGNLLTEDFLFGDQITRYDLELHAWEREEGLKIHLIYNRSLFDEWRIKQFLNHYESLLDILLQNPTQKISEIDFLSDSEKTKLLKLGEADQAPFPMDLTLPLLIEKWAQSHPELLALVHENQSLSFAELNRKANQVASYLLKNKLGKEDFVALEMPRSLDLIVAMLGTMKAGGVYLPLDPSYPADRLAYMLETCAAKFHWKALPDLSHESDSNPSFPVDPKQLAYIIFTSGSTGKPNGVQIEHRSLSNLIYYYQKEFKIKMGEKAMSISSPSFDASVLEIWANLTAGATLYLTPETVRMELGRLVQWIDTEKLNLVFVPTLYLEQLFKMKVPASIRILFTGGDRLKTFPPEGFPQVVNHYGPTENTVVSTREFVIAQDTLSIPSIGKAVTNHQVMIVDANLKLVPLGVPGEILVSGLGLARSYLNRPELSSRKFVHHAQTNRRVYRTGDLARFLPDGRIDYLGRIDHQIKLRGYRIEVDEISQILLEYPGIEEAFTMLRNDDGKQSLVSYLVLKKEHSSTLSEKFVNTWQELYDREYERNKSEGERFNIKGWNSSFTGKELAAHEMKEWVDNTVSLIQSFGPKKVLEIGCGSGLLFFPLLPQVDFYVATDISAETIKNVSSNLNSEEKKKTELFSCPAHDLSQLNHEQSFDTIVMNSVVQYFPHEDYLLTVINNLLSRLNPGGRLIIGDVRNNDHAGAFHLQIELNAHTEEDSTTDLLGKVEMRLKQDKELLLSPAFFVELEKKIPDLFVELKAKSGTHHTEMNLYRYDVILHRKVKPDFLKHIQAKTDLKTIQEHLSQKRVPQLFCGLEDQRNAGMLEAFKNLKSGTKGQKIGNLKRQIENHKAYKIQELKQLAESLKYRMELNLGSRGLDVLFVPMEMEKNHFIWDKKFESTQFSNDPLLMSKHAMLRPKIRDYLAGRLPEYMIPGSFVFLDSLPQTSNGKINSKALPAPESHRPDLKVGFVNPETDEDKKICELMATTLGIDLVGMEDNFFELGGHSLLAVELVSKIHEHFGKEIQLSHIFEKPSARGISERLKQDTENVFSWNKNEEDPDQVPLTPMDLTFHYGRQHLGSSDHSWYQVMEMEVEKLQREKLKAAILYAVNLHPLARARLSDKKGMGKKVFWDTSLRLKEAPLEIYQVESDAEADAIIDRTIMKTYPLEEAPTCRFVWIHGNCKERLLLRYNHSAVDASGLKCLLNSLMSHYLGEKDPAKKILPFSTEELLQYYSCLKVPMMENAEMAHFQQNFPHIFPDTIVPRGGNEERFCRAIELNFTPAETEHMKNKARINKTTLDRLFMLGILTGAELWNESYSGKKGRIEAYWAVNLRPPQLFDSIVSNQFAWARVGLGNKTKEEILNPGSDFLLKAALDWIQMVDKFHLIPLPNFVKKKIVAFLNLGAPSMFISNTLTVSVTELGTDSLSKNFGVKRMQNHSRFAFSNRPVIVIGKTGENLRLRMVYPRQLFDDQNALLFLEKCKENTLCL